MEPHRSRPAPRDTGTRPARRGDAALDADWLEGEAIRYVARWETTRRGVVEVLERRLARRCDRTGEDPETVRDAIPQVAERLVARGYVDDRRYAEQAIERLRRQGRSRAQIHARLRERGVPGALVEEVERERAESRRDEVGEELDAAWQTARKRRLGPYCPDPELRRERKQRHLAVLARQGFSREIAYRVIEADGPPDRLEESDR